MKRYSILHKNALLKYSILFSALLLIIISSSKAQQIYSDDELLSKAKNYYNNDNYIEAQAYFFAYVQRNTHIYQTDSKFKSNIEAALQFATSQASGAGTKATFDLQYTVDAQGNRHIIRNSTNYKPELEDYPAPVSNLILNSGVFNCDDGSMYYVTVIHEEVWCFGRNSDNNWTNVIHGFISGDEILANWASFPTNSKNSGTMTLKIDNRSFFNVTNQTGGFAGKSFQQSKSSKKTPNNG
jgi:hypothetical protein